MVYIRKKKDLLEDRRASDRRGKIIAVTGNIGAGKSFILGSLHRLGFAKFSADLAVAKLLKHPNIVSQIAVLFPDCVNSHHIDKEKLRDLVFQDAGKLKQLEAIIHPEVRAERNKFIKNIKRNSKKNIAIEIPLLYKTKQTHKFDGIIEATAPKFIQQQRVINRGLRAEQIKDILTIQGQHKFNNLRKKVAINTGQSKPITFNLLLRKLRKTFLKL